MIPKKDKQDIKLALKGQTVIEAAYYDDLVSTYKIVISSRIFLLRIQHDISQRQLGEYLSITSQAVTLLEKGKRVPSFEVLCKLADYFDVSLDYLVGRSDSPERH